MKNREKRGWIVTSAVFTLGLLGGDASMLVVIQAVKQISDNEITQYFIAMTIIAIGAYMLFGYPQLRAWRAGTAEAVDPQDLRFNWAVQLLQRGGWPWFVAASLLEGPIGVGWYVGYIQHPRANQLTWLSAWILSVAWTAVYLWIGWKAFVAVVVGFTILGLLEFFRRRRNRASGGVIAS